MINNKIKLVEDEKLVEETLDLLIECRRCISYTYVIAYYLGYEKKEFFQFLQAELERNLEIFDEQTDKDFKKIFESSFVYINWKTNLKNLKEVLKNYCENILSDLEKNLPELQVLEKQKSLRTGKTINLLDVQIKEDEHWYCMACTFANTPEKTNCDMCGTRRIEGIEEDNI